MKPRKDISERILVGTSTLQSGDNEPQTFKVSTLAPDLPTDSKKKEVCLEHLRNGAASELMEDFDLGGVHFPKLDEPQEITTQLSCTGVGCILKKCGLQITQYNSDGEEIGSMKASS